MKISVWKTLIIQCYSKSSIETPADPQQWRISGSFVWAMKDSYLSFNLKKSSPQSDTQIKSYWILSKKSAFFPTVWRFQNAIFHQNPSTGTKDIFNFVSENLWDQSHRFCGTKLKISPVSVDGSWWKMVK